MPPRRLDLERIVGEQRRRFVLVAIGLVAVVAIVWIYMAATGGFPGDRALAEWARTRPPSERFNNVNSFFGGWAAGPIAISVVVLGAAVAGRRLGPRAAAMVLVAALAGPLNQLVASVLGPPPLAAEFFRGQSVYPSGHAAFASAIGGVLAVLAWSRGLWEAALIIACVALATGLSRVLSGAHALSDVLAAYALGGAWLLLVLAVAVPRPAPSAVGDTPSCSSQSAATTENA
jgi:hypothetical protein